MSPRALSGAALGSLALIGLAGSAFAGSEESGFEAKLERWRKMSPEKQERIRRRFEKWKALPSEEKERVRGHLRALRELPRAEREEFGARLVRWEGLSPEEQKRVQKLAGRIDRLPREKRAAALAVCEVVRLFPPETRKRLRGLPDSEKKPIFRQLARLFEGLGAQEREALANLPPGERRKRLLALVRDNRARVEAAVGALGPVFSPVDDRDDREERPQGGRVRPEVQRYWHSLPLDVQNELQERARRISREHPALPPRETLLRLIEERMKREAPKGG